MNWVDLCVLLVLGLFLFDGLRRGFWYSLTDLLSFVVAIAAATRFYRPLATWLADRFALPYELSNGLAIIALMFFAGMAMLVLTQLVLQALPAHFWAMPLQRLLGAIPAITTGILLSAIILAALGALPLQAAIRNDIAGSKIAGHLTSLTRDQENRFSHALSELVRELAPTPLRTTEPNDRVALPYLARRLAVDEEAESQMLTLVNQERRAAGLRELQLDPSIVQVARGHSTDMWLRQYFAHVDPDGNGPAERLLVGGVSFGIAGENLALTDGVRRAHDGLMNSTGHRKNILDPRFARVGVGIVDGGRHGKMFTQNFAD